MPEPLNRALARMFLMLVLVGCPSAFAATHYGDVQIQITAPPGGESSFGYMEYQATIVNSGKADHKITLMIPQLRMGGYGYHIRQISRTTVVPAGSAVTISLFQPPLPIYGRWAAVAIDDRVQQDSIQLSDTNHCRSFYRNGDRFCVLLSRGIGYDNVNQGLLNIFNKESRSMMGPMPMGYSGTGVSSFLAPHQVPISDWSRNWLSYSRYSGILLTGQEWTSAPPAVKRALLEYARCGGCLSIIGDGGFKKDVSLFGQSVKGRFDISYLGFGMVLTTSREDLANWASADWELLLENWKSSSRNLNVTRGIKDANDWFPVVESLAIPVRGLLLIVLIFAILMGPANLFILSRKKRQIWLLWTVPVLSLTASAIVFGYAIFAEGWKGHTRTQSLTILDQRENLAATIGVAAFYCPLTPRDGLHFDYETECTVQVNRDMYRSGSSNGRQIDWSQDQHLTSGWVNARVPAHFKLRKSQMRREKIIFSGRQPLAVTALNGFGVPVETLYYADEEGTVYRAENIQPGAKVQMQRMDLSLPQNQEDSRLTRKFFESDWHGVIDSIVKEPVQYLRPNCYIAIVREPLFVEQALGRQKSEVFESVVYGISRGETDAG